MTISKEELAVIEEEHDILNEVLGNLKEQMQASNTRLANERGRSRALTSQLVAARTDEDKALLASDEAVSHALKDKQAKDIKRLERSLKKPYFARFVVKEENNKELEYKLGFAANPDCRIVDWRKAPISKLYYEYREGDEYCENIQGREREGKVILRNGVEIENAELKRITCRHGAFEKREEEWHRLANAQSHTAGKLKQILTLITPDQFQLITEDANTAVLVQGIAGSGKTTVALHRLAWLLHEDNRGLNPEHCVVVVLTNALKNYAANTLPSMDIHGVPVLSYQEWTEKQISHFYPELLDENAKLKRPEKIASPGSIRLKSSTAFMKLFEQKLSEENLNDIDFYDFMSMLLSNEEKILESDSTKLLDAELIDRALSETSRFKAEKVVDKSDEALLIRFIQKRFGAIRRADGSEGFYDHVVIDEVQDLIPMQLASLLNAVKETKDLTIVGDTAQQLNATSLFAGWEALQKSCNLEGDISRFVTLTVSHRSTLPIMKLADHIQQRKLVSKGRRGRVPIWFKAHSEQKALRALINWLRRALELYPHAISAVLTRDAKEAKLAYSMLKPSFGPSVRLGDNHNFSFEEGLIVTDLKQAKGLEFTNVLIWNPSKQSYPDDEYHRNALYVGVTRAEENLAIVTWQRPSVILPHIHSKLVRGIDLTLDE